MEVSSPTLIGSSAAAASIALFYAGLGTAAYYLMQRKYMKMQKLLISMIALYNLRYMVLSMSDATTWIGNVADVITPWSWIYDNPTEMITTLEEVQGNPNSLLSSYTCHATWAVDFWKKFTFGTLQLQLCLRIHIILNTAALCLSFFHMFFAKGKAKKQVGQVAALCGFVGNLLGVIVGFEDLYIESYGGAGAAVGWIYMGGSNLIMMTIGVMKAMTGQMAAHKRWMMRTYVQWWGSFLIFRLMLVLGTPIFTDCKQCLFVGCIWSGPTIGLALGELVVRLRYSKDYSWAESYKAK